MYHAYKNGKSTIEGFLEDYAFTIEAFIKLYKATTNESYLRQAKQLTDYCLDYFYDETQQFFAFNSRNSSPLIAQHFETEDNVMPASNSIMANNLYILSILFDNEYYEKIALKMLHHIIPNIDYASAYSNWLNLWLNLSDDNKELAICGENALAEIKKINTNYLPNVIIVGSSRISTIPILKDRFVANEILFYVCQNKTCLLPKKHHHEVLLDLKK